ncbi:MAG: hypothetical protein QOC60_673 [Frankiaceae bacterium]|jgi:hypothetical protein|nr:hypothetical protein [Frankiaceae bacterium]
MSRAATRALTRARAVRAVVVLLSVALLGTTAVTDAQAALAPALVTGQDIGWPMCPAALGGKDKPMPPDATAGFVIPELNAGLAFVANQCLAGHYDWGRQRNAKLGGYLFPNYPDAQMLAAAVTGRYGACSTLQCQLVNSGYAQAKWDVEQLATTGVTLPMIWVDIEHQPRLNGTRMWSSNIANNRLVLGGVFAYLREHHIRIGVYSYPNGFNQIVGNWALTYPEWIPTGGHLASERLARCAKPGFSAGPVWMTQSTRLITAYDIDDDTICPAAAPATGLMFADPVTNGPVVGPVSDGKLTRFAHLYLRVGSRGSAVVALQHRLRVPATGTYGPATAWAVAHFQQLRGWHGSGIVNLRTWVALGA